MSLEGTPLSAQQSQSQQHKACDSCYRSKLKCVGRDNPPCQRCVTGGLECTFDGRRKSKITLVENRLSDMETQMETMAEQLGRVQSQLSELLAGRGGGDGGGTHRRGSEYKAVSTPGTVGSVQSSHHPRAVMSPLAGDDAHYHSLSVGMGRKREHDDGTSRERERDGAERRAQQSSYHDAAVEETSGGEVDEDPLLEAARLAPMHKMRNIADTRRPSVTSPERPVKRLRGDEYQTSPASLPSVAALGAGETPTDPVTAGLCSAARGHRLLMAFFKFCHNSLPIFDPEWDTWESLRSRSSLALTTVMAVGAKFEEQTNEVVELQRKLQERAEWMAKETLFAPPAPNEMDLEAIQAMVVLSAYGDTEWRPGGHAFRMAMERCLYRCLPHLVQTGMGARKSADELEAEREVVVGARVWLAVCKFEFEMAFNHGRPILIGDETSIPLGRQLLEHPLSTKLDGRLVAACELLAGRHRAHLVFGPPPHSSMARSIAEVGKDNEFFERWFERWMAHYDHLNLPEGHFLRDILITGKNHAILITNARLLYGVTSPRDVEALIPERREALSKCVQSASILIHMAVASEGYKDHFLAANSNTHVAMVFAARLLIRFATLAPESVDLRRSGREIEELAAMLKRGTFHELADQIQAVLTRARNKRVLPPRSLAASPRRGVAELHADLGQQHGLHTDVADASNAPPPPLAATGFDLLSDFQFADELFNGAALSDGDAMNLLQWFREDWREDAAYPDWS